MPTMMGTSDKPPNKSVLPNVKRGNPAGLFMPTLAISKPRNNETKPFNGLPLAIMIEQVSPRSTSQKYS